ncbi:hypothetical protein HDU83_003089 [Entophlyctis luteolus]|nr:hypothetical protein HDU83_003089 [Entophlyctis luteolus]
MDATSSPAAAASASQTGIPPPQGQWVWVPESEGPGFPGLGGGFPGHGRRGPPEFSAPPLPPFGMPSQYHPGYGPGPGPQFQFHQHPHGRHGHRHGGRHGNRKHASSTSSSSSSSSDDDDTPAFRMKGKFGKFGKHFAKRAFEGLPAEIAEQKRNEWIQMQLRFQQERLNFLKSLQDAKVRQV